MLQETSEVEQKTLKSGFDGQIFVDKSTRDDMTL